MSAQVRSMSSLLSPNLVRSRSSQVRPNSGHIAYDQGRSGQLRTCKVMAGQVKSYQIKTGRAMSKSGQVRSGQVGSGQFRSGQVMSDQGQFRLCHVMKNTAQVMSGPVRTWQW